MKTLIGLLFAVGVSGADLNALTAQEKSQGWKLLFDGKTLTGWHADNGSQWKVADGAMVPSGDTAGYLSSDEVYRDLALKIDFRCPENTNSGVFVRAPSGPGGYEVQIWASQPAGFNTGGIVGTAKAPPETKFIANQWNSYEITADGDHLIVILNGKTVLDVHDAKFTSGMLRLQYQKLPIEFRNVKLRPIQH